MADDIRVNDLPVTGVVNNSDKLMLIQNNTSTKQVAVEDISSHILKDTEVDELATSNKTSIGAINELNTKAKDLDERVGELEKMGRGLNKIKMDLVFADISGNGE